MKLLDLHINGFGKFHDLTVTFTDGINLIYGDNEAGKSTLHTFIRGMLFGIERARGRASKNDLYSKYEPWENSMVYEGTLRLESHGTVYRIERIFQKSNKEFAIINETLGKEEDPSKAFLDELLCGLNEITYNNTISIGQLKSATDSGMVSELKNYIANLNTTGNVDLNINAATAFLKARKKDYESQLSPEAAKKYTSLLGEIRNIEKEVSSPEYANEISMYQAKKKEAKLALAKKQEEKEDLIEKTAKEHQRLSNSSFGTNDSIQLFQKKAAELYSHYETYKSKCSKKSLVFYPAIAVLLATALAAGVINIYIMVLNDVYAASQLSLFNPTALSTVILAISILLYISGITVFMRRCSHKNSLKNTSDVLSELFGRFLTDNSISSENLEKFNAKMNDLLALSESIEADEASLNKISEEIRILQKQQDEDSSAIEKQQWLQWELEQKLMKLSDCKTQAAALKEDVAENDRLREEISAIELALDTISELSSTIRDSFGLYLNSIASSLISGITGGAYNSMSVDENLNVYLNTKTKLIPLEQTSSGTMDQVYLALRLAAANLLCENETLPLIFDDSFSLYDDKRLESTLTWLAGSHSGQKIMFTCHHRESRILDENDIKYNLIYI